MIRLKFLTLFALPVLALWAGHLFVLSPAASEQAVARATAEATLASHRFSGRLQERRSELQRAALALSGTPALVQLLQPVKGKAEPSADKLRALRGWVQPHVSEALQPALFLALVGESGFVQVRGDAEPSDAAPDGASLSELAQAGAQGRMPTLFGSTHLVYSFPVAMPGKADAEILGHVVLGAPLLPEGAVEAVTAERGLVAVALLSGGKGVASAGPKKALAEQAPSLVTPGQSAVVSRGSVSALGALKLPLFTQGNPRAMEDAPLSVASREAVPGTPFEVVSVASVESHLLPLAEYQKRALVGAAGLFGLALVVTLLLGSARPAAVTRASAPAGDSAPFARTEDVVPVKEPSASPAPEAPPASPDDFQFPPPPPPPSGEFERATAPPPAPFDNDVERTVAYALVSSAAVENPDATRVASVPSELLQKSARSEETQTRAAVASEAAGEADQGEQAHFQQVFEDFVATRQQCGEPADGLTFDKFVLKLSKNREQLMQKYGCRTVRFQVYVKEGKAALRATPVKE